MNLQESVRSEPKRRHVKPFDPAAEVIQTRHLKLVTGLAPVTCWRLRRQGLFPQPLRLSAGRIGWRRSDLEAWLAERQQSK